MITVSGLTKKYGDRNVVDDVSFTLEPGTVTGFLGPAALAAATEATGSQRAGMATVLAFLGLGAAILATVREPRAVPAGGA